jgi:dTDP-4-amino-4,6-dideoxygalactose transaminase
MAPLFTKISPFLGSSMRVSEISGAIMRVQLGRLEAILSGLRARKRLWAGALEGVKGASVIRGNCPDGDCATTLHLLFSDPLVAGTQLKQLRTEGFPFSPVTARPAHASWKWSFLLGERAAATPARNPFTSPDARRTFENARVLPSIEILTRVLKMDVDLTTETEATQGEAEKLARLIDRT